MGGLWGDRPRDPPGNVVDMEYKIQTKPVLVLPSSGRDPRLILRVEGEILAFRPGYQTDEPIERHHEVMIWESGGAPAEVGYYKQAIADLSDKVARELSKRLDAVKAATQAVESVGGEVLFASEQEDC